MSLSQRSSLRDLSLWFLLFSNLVTIFFAVKEGWNLQTVLWIYWFQSITIGFFNFIRILLLREFSSEGLRINGRSVQPTKSKKIFIAFFFLFHYGGFHLSYLFFLLTSPFFRLTSASSNFIDIKYVLITALLFFVNHLFSFIFNRSRDTKKQNIGTLMFYPYARIIPMHLIIVTGSFFSAGALPLFLILKTISDVIMHTVEHKINKGEEQVNVQ